jgi:WD40 repeat protein
MHLPSARFASAVSIAVLTVLGWTITIIASDELVILKGHTGGVTAVAFSSDGQILASASADDTVKLWHVSTGELHSTVGGHSGAICSMALSSDGKTLATGASNGDITLWDVTLGSPVMKLSGHLAKVRCLAFSPDGAWLISGSADKTIRQWNAKTGALKTVFAGHTRGIFCVAFAGDGKTLASGSGDETVRIWSVERGCEMTFGALLQRNKRGTISSVAFSPDGGELAITTPDLVQVWDVVHSQCLFELPGQEKGSIWWSAHYAPQGKLFAIGSGAKYAHAIRLDAKKGVSTGSVQAEDDEIRVWDARSRKIVRSLSGHHDSVRSVALSPDGTLLASGSRDRTVRLWDLTGTPRPLQDGMVEQVAGTSGVSGLDSLSDDEFLYEVWNWDCDDSLLLWGGISFSGPRRGGPGRVGGKPIPHRGESRSAAVKSFEHHEASRNREIGRALKDFGKGVASDLGRGTGGGAGGGGHSSGGDHHKK